MLYNEPYAQILGNKHPQALGQRGVDCFPEIWDLIGPMLAGVREQGEATWSPDQLVELDRSGFVEECYFTFGFSPIRDESGDIDGIFTAVAETTDHVIGARRLRILRELTSATTGGADAAPRVQARRGCAARKRRSFVLARVPVRPGRDGGATGRNLRRARALQGASLRGSSPSTARRQAHGRSPQPLPVASEILLDDIVPSIDEGAASERLAAKGARAAAAARDRRAGRRARSRRQRAPTGRRRIPRVPEAGGPAGGHRYRGRAARRGRAAADRDARRARPGENALLHERKPRAADAADPDPVPARAATRRAVPERRAAGAARADPAKRS